MKMGLDTRLYTPGVTNYTVRQGINNNYQNSHKLNQADPRFGNGIAKWLGKMYADTTGRIIIVDLVGFGFVRTTLDLFREFFYKKTEQGKRQLNYMAARERIVREVGCIFIANFLGGILSNNAARVANGMGYKNMVQNYASLETLKMFQNGIAKNATPEGLFNHIAKTISHDHAGFVGEQIKKVVAAGPANESVLYKAANEILHKISPGKDCYDVLLKVGSKTHEFQIDTLLKDTATLMHHVPGSPVASWQNQAKKIVDNTMKFNKFSIPSITAAVLTLTVLVPLWNIMFTRKVDKTKDYPGLQGLKELEKIEAKDNKLKWHEKMFPYVTQTLRKGDPIPFLGSILPLPFALGMTHNIKMGEGLWKSPGLFKGFINTPGRGFFKRALSIFQFGKAGLNSTGQQIAAVCAMVCAARQGMSRNKIEFRERTIDATGSWILWLVAIPLISTAIAKRFDANWGTKLLKNSPVGLTFRNGKEIANLLPKGVSAKTASLAGKFNNWLTLTTIVLVGVIEPMIAIKWSESQVRKDKQKAYELLNARRNNPFPVTMATAPPIQMQSQA